MPVIMVLHHHVNRLWLPVDRIRLAAPEALVAVLKSHTDIRQVIAGHVHLPSAGTWHGLPCTTLCRGAINGAAQC